MQAKQQEAKIMEIYGISAEDGKIDEMQVKDRKHLEQIKSEAKKERDKQR